MGHAMGGRDRPYQFLLLPRPAVAGPARILVGAPLLIGWPRSHRFGLFLPFQQHSPATFARFGPSAPAGDALGNGLALAQRTALNDDGARKTLRTPCRDVERGAVNDTLIEADRRRIDIRRRCEDHLPSRDHTVGPELKRAIPFNRQAR